MAVLRHVNTEQTLPPGLYWFELDGRRAFAVYAASGGLDYRSISYIFRRGEGDHPPVTDMGLPKSGDLYTIFRHERGWKHAAVWSDCDRDALEACIGELLD